VFLFERLALGEKDRVLVARLLLCPAFFFAGRTRWGGRLGDFLFVGVKICGRPQALRKEVPLHFLQGDRQCFRSTLGSRLFPN